jgi:deoxyxylulose-5-phosphate synthase
MFKAKTGKMVRPYPVYAGYGVLDTRTLNIELGDPSIIVFKKQRTAYIIYSPYATETASSVAQSLREQGISVTLVNGASDPRADKLQKWAVKVYSHLCSIS